MVVLTVIVAIAIIYAWSRAVEGTRQAKDRLMTLLIASAFALALIPLLSLLYEVVKRGHRTRFDVEFFTESARGVDRRRRRRRARDRRHAGHHRRRDR